MLYATGLTRADMEKAQVGIASVWYEGNPCNMHLNDLAAETIVHKLPRKNPRADHRPCSMPRD